MAGADLADPDNKQRFLLEPQDVYAIVGQREATLSCAVQGKAGILYWFPEPYSISHERTIRVKKQAHHYSVSVRHISLNELLITQQQQQQQQLGNLNGSLPVSLDDQSGHLSSSLSHQQEQGANGTTSTPTQVDAAGGDTEQVDDGQLTNGGIGGTSEQSVGVMYTLHIKNVQLQDDAPYNCRVSRADDEHRRIMSREARLHVLQPPTKLDIQMLATNGPQQVSADTNYRDHNEQVSSRVPESRFLSQNRNRNQRLRASLVSWPRITGSH